MLNWTGERFVPWAKEAAVAYEHLHRYLWASTLVKGKRVLDLASGEGYGANLLARHAAYVCGVDIDEAAVRHAAENYSKPNLQFLRGSITNVPISDDHSFDMIVCFEAIEHIEEHDALLSEVKRLLTPEGLFVVSTPNKDVYDTDGEASNPFHVKELTFDEFNTLLEKYFSDVVYLGQRLHPASSLWPIGLLNGKAIQEFVIERGEAEFSEVSTKNRVPRYFVGIASDSPGIAQSGSVLLDHSDELTDLLNEKDRDLSATKVSADKARAWFEEQLAERNEALARRAAEVELLNHDVEQLSMGNEQLNKDVEQLNKDVEQLNNGVQQLNRNVEELNRGAEQLNKALEWAQTCNQDLERTVASRDEALEWRAGQVDALEKAKIELFNRLQVQAEQLQATNRELGLRKQELAEIHLSRGWRVVRKLRALRDSLKGILGK